MGNSIEMYMYGVFLGFGWQLSSLSIFSMLPLGTNILSHVMCILLRFANTYIKHFCL